MARYPDVRLTVIVLTNSDQGNPQRIGRRVASFFVPALAPVPPKTIDAAEPRVADLIRTLHDQAAEGKLDPALFVLDTWAGLSPYAAQVQTRARAAGPIRSIGLFGRATEGRLHVHTYRVVHENATRIIRLGLTAEGKVAFIAPEDED